MTVSARERRAGTGAWTAVLRPATGEPEGRVVVFPHSGAGPNVLMPLLRHLPANLEVVGVTLPGRERRFSEGFATTPDDPDAVVDGIARELAPLPGRPTVFFGHSMGVAVAVAVALARPGLCGRLVLSGHPPSGANVERTGAWDEPTLLAIIRLGGGTPPEVLEKPLWRRGVLDLLRSDLMLGAHLVRRNRASRLPIPLTLLNGADDELVGVEQLASWESRTDAGARLRVFPGGHFYLLDEANLRAVAAEIAGTAHPG
jgi:surfactin synthase thioesterase subunit